jgi:V-type H+-transporting ATPase subunit a
MASSPVDLQLGTRNGSNDNSFYRSASMSLIQLYIPTEAAQAVVAELGELGVVQFRDLNPDVTAFQRTFTVDIRKLDAMERKILTLLMHASKEEVEIRSWISAGPTPQGGSLVPLRGKALQELDELEPHIVEAEARILQLDESQKEITTRYLHTLEWHSVITACSPFMAIPYDTLSKPLFLEGDSSTSSEELRSDDRDIDSLEIGGTSVAQGMEESNFVAGVIQKKKLAAFERVLWRALRGNVFIRSADCPIDARGLVKDADLMEPKSAFVAYVHGRETLARLRKICEALGCTLHDVDPSSQRRHDILAELDAKISDMYAVLFNTRQAKRAALNRVSESLERWLLLVRKKKALLDTMNGFSCDSDISTRKYYLAEGWCPTASLVTIDASIKTASERSGINVAPVLTVLEPGNRDPPTYFPTNVFTESFQGMTDAYSVGKYREANPSIFMIVSFPFLFAVMFGDVGHALIMATFAIWMVLDEKRLLSQRLGEIFAIIFTGRYIILLMGLFAIFTGFMYNDFMSRAMAILPSAWRFVDGRGVRVSPNYVYPFGIDPIWSLSANMMSFINSYKMKMAILLGVAQMLFGLFVSLSNCIYFDNWLEIYTTIIPQFIFMLSFLGYIVFLIIYKWLAGWDVSILNTLITMILGFGKVEGTPIYFGQGMVQACLLSLILITVPWMFVAKPIYLTMEQRRLKGAHGTVAYQAASENGDSPGADSVSSTNRKAAAEDSEHDLGELWVHQLIHTIEFVLGSISNTASYLRLWALSLAHAELSEVLWQMAIEKAVFNPLVLCLVFPPFFGFTVGVLVGMEGLSAFLHALRLHWVEFNNKFYVGGGVKFEPFALGSDQVFLQPGESN